MVLRHIHFDAALSPPSTGLSLSSQIQLQSSSSPSVSCHQPYTFQAQKITHHFPNTLSSCVQEPAWNSTLPTNF